MSKCLILESPTGQSTSDDPWTCVKHKEVRLSFEADFFMIVSYLITNQDSVQSYYCCS